MPRKVPKPKKKNVRRHHKKSRSSAQPPHQTPRPSVPEQIGSAAGRLAENVVTELARPVKRATNLSVPYVDDANRPGFLDTLASITGAVLALTSLVIAAPFTFVLQALTISSEDDLKSREYRDEAGQTHHHTRTFMRDHGGKLRPVAA